MAKLLGPVGIETRLVDVFSAAAIRTHASRVNKKQAAIVKLLIQINYTFNTHLSTNRSS